jgi:hypothetical protein
MISARPCASVRTTRGSCAISALLDDQRIGQLTDPQLECASSNGGLASQPAHVCLTGTDLFNNACSLIYETLDASGRRRNFKAKDEHHKGGGKDQRTRPNHA